MKQQMIALVIGASSSLGTLLSRELAKQGYHLQLAAREKAQLERLSRDLMTRFGTPVTTLPIDLVDIVKQSNDWISTLPNHPTHIFFITGDHTESETLLAREDIERQYTVNMLAPTLLIKRCLETFPKDQALGIIVVSTVLGERGFGCALLESSSKGALQLLLQGLRHRIAHTHRSITLSTVLTGMVDSSRYYHTQHRFITQRAKVVEAIIKAAQKRKHVVYVPGILRLVLMIIRNMPEWMVLKLPLSKKDSKHSW